MDTESSYTVSLPLQKTFRVIDKGQNSKTTNLKLMGDELHDPNEQGLLEYDGEDLCFTTNDSKLNLSRSGPAGMHGPMGAPGIDGSFGSANATITGTLSFNGAGQVANLKISSLSWCILRSLPLWWLGFSFFSILK